MSRRLILLGPIGLLACASVLGIRQDPARPFEHRAHVLKGVTCVRCHARVASSTESGPVDLPGTAACLLCHDKPHDARTCSQCHGLASNREALMQAKLHLRFDHSAHRSTAAGQCVRCHNNIADPEAPLRPGMATCLSCHEHQQQWAARSCNPCHRNLEQEQVRPLTHVVHGDSFLRDHGSAAAASRDLCSSCHAESMCASCHGVNVPALPSTLHFDEPHHADMHAAGFFARHSLEARLDSALCTTCHSEASCSDCHRAQGLLPTPAFPGTRNPHPPGWIAVSAGASRHGIEARQNPMLCASCHGGAGEALCVGCHRVGGPGGNPHPGGFVSSKHLSELPCRMCHTEAP